MASFLTAILHRAYAGWADDAYLRYYFGGASPFARDYRRVFAGPPVPHFEPVTGAVDLQPGDLVSIDYQNGQDTNTGHVVIVRKVKGTYLAPSPTLNFPGETQYAVEVIDCTADPHGVYGVGNYAAYPDTRLEDGIENDGAGYGHMMFYSSNATGQFARYRWSVNSSLANTFTIAQRPIAAARVT